MYKSNASDFLVRPMCLSRVGAHSSTTERDRKAHVSPFSTRRRRKESSVTHRMAPSRKPTSSANHKSRLNGRFNQAEPEPLKSVIMTSTSQASPRGFDCCPSPQRVAVRFVDRHLKYVYDGHRCVVPQVMRAKRAIRPCGFIS